MKYAGIIALIAIFYLSCGKNPDPIPNVGVNFTISLLDPNYSKLRGAGSSAIVPRVGLAGVVIYHDSFDGYYKAYDRCSSYKPENRCAVTVDTSGFTATDPCSGSKFLLNDGSSVKGPATQPLKSYYVSLTGGGYVLSVSN